jgi:hypothetical protein
MTRLEELENLYVNEGWQPIKEIALKYKIPKPNNGWDEAIPLIVEAEKLLATKEVADNKPAPKPKRVIQENLPSADTPWRKPRTDLYGNLIPTPFEGKS